MNHPYLWQHLAHRNWQTYPWHHVGSSYCPACGSNVLGARSEQSQHNLRDTGPQPTVIDIDRAVERNNAYRTTLWTGKHLQVTLMRLGIGEDIGLEVHPEVDQFLRIEEGDGLVQMGDRQDNLYIRQQVGDDDAIMVPAGTWHNVVNTGNKPLKLYSIYAPPAHPHGTVHQTKADALAAEG
ncbi:cupin domain-containing protein [Paenibacillaceae bacterium]|nr:cupin domain-containing protein [Paenibacillaceae bacterium]